MQNVFYTNPVCYEDGIDTLSSKEYSLFVSELIDRVGYSYEMIKYRQQILAERDEQTNRHEHSAYTVVTTGGKGEGTTLHYESDVDLMLIVNDVICADNPQDVIHQENITLFKTETQEAPPAYARLRLLRFDGTCYNEQINSSLFEAETGSYYLSSQFFTSAMEITERQYLPKNEYTAKQTSGPSTPVSGKCMSFDRVVCFKCVCPNIVKRWMSRPRSNGWPSPETVHEISLLDGHVVPVGSKGSQNMYKEWRICFSLAELHLMRNLNETQLKVYILLKKLCNSVLNPVCKDLTSYIMKNVTLWVCEAKGIDRFTRESIMDRLYDCITYLKKCVDDNILPSYMIPERNLLAGRLNIEQKHQLTCVLSDLLKERGRMFLRCEKLRDAMIMMYKIPNMMRENGEKRDKIERLMLTRAMIRVKTYRPGMSNDEVQQRVLQNELYINMETNIKHLIQFDVQGLLLMGKTSKQISDLWEVKLKKILS